MSLFKRKIKIRKSVFHDLTQTEVNCVSWSAPYKSAVFVVFSAAVKQLINVQANE